MALDGDQSAATQFFLMLFQNPPDIFADDARTYIVQPQLDDAGKRGLGLEKQLGEIKVLRQHHGAVLVRPKHHLRVWGTRRSQVAPRVGCMAMLFQVRHP